MLNNTPNTGSLKTGLASETGSSLFNAVEPNIHVPNSIMAIPVLWCFNIFFFRIMYDRSAVIMGNEPYSISEILAYK